MTASRRFLCAETSRMHCSGVILAHSSTQSSNLEGFVGLFYELWSLVVVVFYWIQVKFKIKFKLSFIVIPLHVWTYSGTRCHASQDPGAT